METIRRVRRMMEVDVKVIVKVMLAGRVGGPGGSGRVGGGDV